MARGFELSHSTRPAEVQGCCSTPCWQEMALFGTLPVLEQLSNPVPTLLNLLTSRFNPVRVT